MDNFFFLLILSLVVIYADYRMTRHNWGVKCNGVGCIGDVLSGKALQPMAYRVLVPLIVGSWGNYVGRYTIVRCLSIFFSLWAANLWFGGACTIWLAVFYIASAIYDYTDGYLEVGFFALSFLLMSNPFNHSHFLIFVIMIFATLNRETSIFIVLAAFLEKMFLLGVVLAIIYVSILLLLRLYFGFKGRYCSFNMIGNNLNLIKTKYLNGFILYNEYTLFFVLLGLFVFGYYGRFPYYSGYEISMGVMFLSLLVPVVWGEIRVFKPVMLVLIPMLLG